MNNPEDLREKALAEFLRAEGDSLLAMTQEKIVEMAFDYGWDEGWETGWDSAIDKVSVHGL